MGRAEVETAPIGVLRFTLPPLGQAVSVKHSWSSIRFDAQQLTRERFLLVRLLF